MRTTTARASFLEDVVKKGIERVSDQRKGKQESAHALRAGLKFTAELWRESQGQSRDSHVLRRRTAMSFLDPQDGPDTHRDPKIHHLSELAAGSHFDSNPLPQAKHVASEKL
jgi:hypothetical protein